MDITILAIESSCDDTSASIIRNGSVKNNIIATQTIHQKYGGVVPELASRDHQKNIVPVVFEALRDANIDKKTISAVAFTQGPGLLGSLLVGSSFAKGLAMAWGVPLIGVNHMRAHILAHFIEEPRPVFPFLCLTVSGGHTQIVLVKSPLDMQVIGETTDDAVGEAFDKCAKLLGLPYPGGPLIDKNAQGGNPLRFSFHDTQTDGLSYSFSGIKTSFLNFLKKETQTDPAFIQNNLPDICASIQHTLVTMLFQKLKRASREYGIDEIGIAGGVSANSYLRASLQELALKQRWNVYIPKFEYCTDNAAMIAMSAHFQYLAGDFVGQDASPRARFPV